MLRQLQLSLLLCLVLALSSSWAGSLNLSIRQHTVQAETANTPHQREQGLMRHTKLCTQCGMLFVFPYAAKYTFWMKNTALPLAIAFISADGIIINIDEMQANTTNQHSARGDTVYALEMNSGWFARNNIKPGDSVQGLEQAPEAQLH